MVTVQTPGQAEYEVWRAAVPDYVCNVPAGPWDELPQSIQAGFAAIAGRERPALQAGEIAYLYHWRFGRGEEFGLYWRAADADAQAAKHAGAEVLSMAILGDRPEPQPAPESVSQVRRHQAQSAAVPGSPWQLLDEACAEISELSVAVVASADRDDLAARCDRLRNLLDDFTHAVIDLDDGARLVGIDRLAKAAHAVREKAGLPVIDQFSKPAEKP